MGITPPAIATFKAMLQHGENAELLSFTGYSHARAGRDGDAREILQQLSAQSEKHAVSPACFSNVYIGLHDRDKAFEYLERARKNHESGLIFARVDQFYDPIRSDTRFAKLLIELGLDDLTVHENQALSKRVYR